MQFVMLPGFPFLPAGSMHPLGTAMFLTDASKKVAGLAPPSAIKSEPDSRSYVDELPVQWTLRGRL
jgi:hypothetical protein